MSLISEYALRRAFRPSVRAKLWRRLAARAALGLPVWDAIEDARGRAEGKNPGFARACNRLLLARDSGLGLADGLGGLGAPGEGLLLSAGESSGRTAEGLSLAAELLETRGRVAKEVKSGLAYPVFLVLLSVIVLVLTSGLIVPQLAAVLDPESWTGAAAWLYALSGFLNSSRGFFLGLVLILLIILTVTSLGTWTGPLRQRLDAFGPWKLHALSEGSAFLFTLATLSRAGVQTRVVLRPASPPPPPLPGSGNASGAFCASTETARIWGTPWPAPGRPSCLRRPSRICAPWTDWTAAGSAFLRQRARKSGKARNAFTTPCGRSARSCSFSFSASS